MKRIIKELGQDPDQWKPAAFLGTISKAKNELIGPQIFAERSLGHWEERVSRAYDAYQKKLKEQSALDFDDLIMFVVEIFKKFPEILKKYQNAFRYILVDEYQDTNHAQYVLVKMLAEKYKNICVVGDDWQSIYMFRGANLRNILDFEKDYPEAKVIKLEQNYRSTQAILDAAYGVISKNINRKDKKVWTENDGGHLLISYEAEDEKDEAEFIAREIKRLCHSGKSFAFSDFVVLYRTNAQSRIIEEVMLRSSLPYRMIGGIKFYHRKEVKDVIAYLRLISNFSDSVSLERIINEPRRNIGEVTVNNWIKLASLSNLNLIEAGLALETLNSKFPASARPRQSGGKIQNSKFDPINKFCDFIKRMSDLKDRLPLADFIAKVFAESGYEKYLLDGTDIGQARYENVMELLTVAKKYDEYPGEEGLRLFLEEVALIADTDNIDQRAEAVHLMTLHSAKGLEFKIVFIAGLEEGLLPHSRSMLNPAEMEEERRLMYVGVTRAKEKVYLLFTRQRNIYGTTQINAPSRFLDDIPAHLVKTYDLQPATYNNNFSKKSELSPPASHISPLKDGDRVRHEVFGEGIIISSKGDELTIAFSKAGLKKLSASIAPIRKIN
jgi:DNA helicase-2/ATP-dependent DNA helicase PcrA